MCENFMHKIITLFRQLRFKQSEVHTMLIDYRVKNRQGSLEELKYLIIKCVVTL